MCVLLDETVISSLRTAKCIPDGNNVYRCAHPLRNTEICKPAIFRYLCAPGLLHIQQETGVKQVPEAINSKLKVVSCQKVL